MSEGNDTPLGLTEHKPLQTGGDNVGTSVTQTNGTVHDFINNRCSSKDEDDDRPFYVINMSEVERRCAMMEQCLPTVTPFYAVKCNDDPLIIGYLAQRGMSFDCASKGEIQQILEAGVEPERIILANTNKPVSDLKFAAENGVNKMTFDSVDELYKIKTYFPEARLVIRIKEPAHNTNEHVENRLSDRFGCHVDKAKELLQTCVDLDLQVIGVSFHVGVGCHHNLLWVEAIAQARQVFEDAREMGINMSLLDIGGGYPGGRKDDAKLTKIFADITAALDQHFPPLSGVEVISEPGTYFVRSAVTLVSRVIARNQSSSASPKNILPEIHDLYRNDIKSFDTSVETVTIMEYVLNVGLYNAFLGAKVDGRHHKAIVATSNAHTRDTCLLPSILWGPTCDSADRVTQGIVLLPKLELGAWLYFEGIGNYGEVCATNFNRTGLPYNVYIKN